MTFLRDTTGDAKNIKIAPWSVIKTFYNLMFETEANRRGR